MSRTLRGRVEFRDLEGGLYQLVGEDGSRTTLLGARKELQGLVGARVEVAGREGAGFGLAMAGPELQVERVRRL